MKLFQTYKEAVIDNNSTRGVFTTHEKWMGVPEMYGLFSVEEDTIPPVVDDRKWIECDPYNYLETLKSFLASGKQLREEDTVVQDNASVVVLEYEDVEDWNSPDIDDDKRFILQAATDQIDTSEEEKAFNVIDTTPHQVESLGKIEWKNGDKVSSDGMSGVFVGLHPDDHELCYVMEDGIDNPVLWHTNRLSKPETLAEREERERDEMAKQLMMDMCGENVFTHRDWGVA